MTAEPYTFTSSERACTLLAAGGSECHFNTPFTNEDLHLTKTCAPTAMYAVQAATAHALLAMVDELAGLRAEVQQIATARADLVNLVEAVSGITGAVTTATAQVSNVGDQVEEVATQLSELGAAVGDGLLDIAVETGCVAAAIDLRGRRSWFSRWRRRTNTTPHPTSADAELEVSPR